MHFHSMLQIVLDFILTSSSVPTWLELPGFMVFARLWTYYILRMDLMQSHSMKQVVLDYNVPVAVFILTWLDCGLTPTGLITFSELDWLHSPNVDAPGCGLTPNGLITFSECGLITFSEWTNYVLRVDLLHSPNVGCISSLLILLSFFLE